MSFGANYRPASFGKIGGRGERWTDESWLIRARHDSKHPPLKHAKLSNGFLSSDFSAGSPAFLFLKSHCWKGSRESPAFGQVGEWLKPTDCKSVPPCEVRRFESFPVHQ